MRTERGYSKQKQFKFLHGFSDHGPTQRTQLGLVQLDDGRARCLACGKNFTTFGNARRHYREVHQVPGSTQFFCQLCNAGFQQKRYCASHMLSVHGITQKMLKNQIIPDEIVLN